jgi:RNA polymerase sigma-70 factor (ECF subfamily)
LHGFVGRRVGNPEDAEDVVQDVFVRMQRNIGALSSADRLDAWAFRIAHNAIADHYRSPNRRDVSGKAAEKVMDELAADGTVDEEPNDARPDGPRALRRLPASHRAHRA